jgi:hypothetical protein
MRAPSIASRIERRLLVNYRLDPETAARILPRGMRPDLAGGFAVGGICLIRLGRLRPRAVPAGLGLRTENAAHRISMLWDGPRGVERGVYIPRRDTSSALTARLGGRVFPSEHHRADFDVREDADRLRVGFRSRDGKAGARVEVRPDVKLAGSRLFGDLAEASRFFRDAPIGHAARESGPGLDAVSLDVGRWEVTPTDLLAVESTYFSDAGLFPHGTAEPDCALLMRDVDATWSVVPPAGF